MQARHDLEHTPPKPDPFPGDRHPELELRMSVVTKISLARAIPPAALAHARLNGCPAGLVFREPKARI